MTSKREEAIRLIAVGIAHESKHVILGEEDGKVMPAANTMIMARTLYEQSHLSDAACLQRIQYMLRDPDWAPGMLEDIAELVHMTGRETDGIGDGKPTWARH